MIKRIVKFESSGQSHWGELDLNSGQVFFVRGSIYDGWERGELAGSFDSLKKLPPCDPRIVAGLAYNYKDLVGDKDNYEEPLLFLKSPNTVISSDKPIQIPKQSVKTWVEVELAVVLKKSVFNASYEEAAEAILGVTVGNDVTTQNVAARDHHLARSKSLPSFCPIGDYLSIGLDTSNLEMTTQINGRTTQRSTTKKRILNEIEALVLISKHIPLSPGDLVLTGTPAGAMDSLISPNDSAILSIAGVGTLSNKIEMAV
jgi:2-keto-4-pentenoate hydratase/2-oxohepta-3-ene-1,7-dioic acid hydratase in catechol pathway